VAQQKDAGGSRPRRGGRGRTTIAIATAAKVACGVVLALITLQALLQLAELRARQDLVDGWSDTGRYAVFFPHSNGNDAAELQTGGHTTKIAEARDLYPILDEGGAIFIDAGNYLPGAPTSQHLPAWPIRVNPNYLDRYPIMDASGRPIRVDDDETSWVVAVPERYREYAAQIESFFRATRAGDESIDGAVQGQERMLKEPVPSRFRSQGVRILWTASGQEVFSFNAEVNAERGNMIVDPIVEIMTTSNSMTVDRLNSITGSLDTPLKVRVDGDPAAALRRLLPTLESLRLDDNLRALVTTNEAMLQQLEELRSTILWTVAVAAFALAVMLAFDVSLVVIVCDRLRRAIAVRRLHGMGRVRAHREIFVLLGVAWLGQSVLAGAILLVPAFHPRGPAAQRLAAGELSTLIAMAVVVLLTELILAAVVAGTIERRSMVGRLKEL